jgi:hypothetical protein
MSEDRSLRKKLQERNAAMFERISKEQQEVYITAVLRGFRQLLLEGPDAPDDFLINDVERVMEALYPEVEATKHEDMEHDDDDDFDHKNCSCGENFGPEVEDYMDMGQQMLGDIFALMEVGEDQRPQKEKTKSKTQEKGRRK